MKRKIVKQGNSALTITLPASWTKEQNVKHGDEIEVLQEQNYLKVLHGEKTEESITLVTRDLNETLLWTYIIAAYRKGYDEIHLKFARGQIKTIQNIVNALLGLAITNQTSTECKIKNLSASPTEKEFNNMIRRIFYLVEEMADSSLEAVKKKNREGLRNIEFQDYNINKFANFCLRIINKKNLPGALEYIIAELENLGDEFARLSLDLADEKSVSVGNEILKVFEDVNGLVSDFHKVYYNFTEKNMVALVNSKNRVNKKINSIKAKTKGESNTLFHLSKVVHMIINLGERTVLMKLGP